MQISKDTLYGNTKQEHKVQTIHRRQLKSIEPCLRRDNEEFIYHYVFYTIHHSREKSKQVRPKILNPEYMFEQQS